MAYFFEKIIDRICCKITWNSPAINQISQVIPHAAERKLMIKYSAVGRKISNKKTFAIKEFVKRSSYEHEFYQHLNDPKGIEAVKEATRVVL